VASERLASIGQLAASVAHEINNPVSFVLASHRFLQKRIKTLGGLAAVMANEPPDSPVVQAWTRLHGDRLLTDMVQATDDLAEGAERIRDIVFDLRGLGHTEEAQIPVDLNDAIRSALRVAATEIRDHASLVTELGPDVSIVGSSGRLSQVFLNLLVNAAQAVSERPGGRGAIIVATRRQGREVIAEVSNNGPPIRAEHLARIFEPFFTTKNPGLGTGLGLSISREIVRRHRGEIRVESSAERGTRFTVVLPVAAPDA